VKFNYTKMTYHPLVLMMVFAFTWVITREPCSLHTAFVFAVWFGLTLIIDLFIYLKNLK